MNKPKVVSFDAEGTLVTPAYSQAVWHEGIPLLYAGRHRLDPAEAKARVEAQYDEVGDQCLDWYDINYWFRRFELGDYRPLLEKYRDKAVYYPDVVPVLSALGNSYPLVITSASGREFLPFLLDGIDNSFERVFSSISDYRQLKSPQFYGHICGEMGIAPAEMVHVGDSWQFDFLAAKEAGVKAFHLDRGPKSQNGSLASLAELQARLLTG